MPANDSGQRRLAAIMFTDMVGFSALSQRNEKLALDLLETQRRLVRAPLTTYGGHEIKTTGDGFLISFESALQAVRCAVAIQSEIKDHNDAEIVDERFLIRIGIHVGDVIEREKDLIGDGVNIAARIE